MVQFTGPNLDQPNAIEFESVASPAPAPELGRLGTAINKFREDRKEEKAAEEESGIFSSVLNEQTELTNSFLVDGEALTAVEQKEVDLFNQGDDYDRQQALQNPSVKAALSKLDRIKQARGQAKSPQQLERFYLQAATITKRIANDHPQYADVVIEASKKALGFDPLEKAIGLEEAASIKQRDFEMAQRKTLVNKAVEAGVVDLGPDGSFDEQDASHKGQALLQQEYMLKQLKDQADLATSQRLPEADLKRNMFSGYMSSLNPSFQSDIGEWGANVLQLYPTLANDPQSQAKLQEAWGVKRASFIANQERYIAEISDPDVQAKAREALAARMKPFDDIFTGDFSTLQNRTRLLTDLNKKAQLDLQTAAPNLSRLLALGGDQVAASVIGTVVTGSDLQGTLTEEISKYTRGTNEGPGAEIQTFNSFLSGEVPLESMTDKQARTTIKHSTAVMNKLAEKPNDVTDQELGVYSTMALQLAAVGINKPLSPDQLVAASNSVSTPSKLRLFERYANDPNSDPEQVQALAEGIGSLNLKNINTQAGLIKEQIAAILPATADLKTGPKEIRATPVYNSLNGRVEIKELGLDRQGRPIPVPRELSKRVDSINQSLQATYMAGTYEGGQLGQLNELQAKQYIVDTAGIPTEGGRVDIPQLQQSVEEPSRTAKTPEEMVDALIEAGRNGDRATIEAILGGQAPRNPSQPLSGGLNDKINAVASQEGVDARLLAALVQAESAGNSSAVSPVGAIGLTQLTPATAKELGVDPNNPDENLRGGARYLRQQLDTFGDPRKALAAYNWGPSRVVKAVEKYGDEWDQHLPKETENYIKKILGE